MTFSLISISIFCEYEIYFYFAIADIKYLFNDSILNDFYKESFPKNDKDDFITYQRIYFGRFSYKIDEIQYTFTLKH